MAGSRAARRRLGVLGMVAGLVGIAGLTEASPPPCPEKQPLA